MHGALGLSQNPFALGAAGDLFWETPQRRAVADASADLLNAGRSVWLRGPAGSGRQELLRNVAQRVAASGVGVALLEPGEGNSALEFLAVLGSLVGADSPSPEDDLLAHCAPLYSRLVSWFCDRGPCVLVVPWAVEPEVLRELTILAELRLVGRPLVAVAALGHQPAPVDAFCEVSLPALDTAQRTACLLHRCSTSGRADLLPPATLERLVAQTTGLQDLLQHADFELRRSAFQAAGDSLSAAEDAQSDAALDPAAVQEVDRLLSSLSPESPEQ